MTLSTTAASMTVWSMVQLLSLIHIYPFKDTSGPSINILIKLLSMVSIVFASVVLSFSLIK